jgi:hypothetical protein
VNSGIEFDGGLLLAVVPSSRVARGKARRLRDKEVESRNMGTLTGRSGSEPS